MTTKTHHRSHSREGPTGAALSLVLDGGDDVVWKPRPFGRCGSRLQTGESVAAGHAGGAGSTTASLAIEPGPVLDVGEVCELIHSQPERGLAEVCELVVGFDEACQDDGYGRSWE